MPLTRTQKEEAVARLREDLSGIGNLVLVNYLGLKVEEVNELRKRIRDSEGKYRVVKNTLALRALAGTSMEGLEEEFSGPVAVAWHPDSPVALAKILSEFAKDHAVMQIKAGVLDGRPATVETVEEFAKLPSRDDLRAKLAYLLQSPLQRTAAVLNVLPRSLAYVLKQGAEKKSGG